MRAAYYEGHETISLGECVPVAPAPGQAQIRVSHCGICGTDLHIFHGKMDHRVKMPQVIGHEMSGVIAAVGESVAGFAPGDRVTVRPLDHSPMLHRCSGRHVLLDEFLDDSWDFFYFLTELSENLTAYCSGPHHTGAVLLRQSESLIDEVINELSRKA